MNNHRVVSLSNPTKEDIETMMKGEESCKIHSSQDVELYCQDCDTLICFLCLKDHSHNKHDLSSLQEFITHEKQGLSKNLEEIERLATNEEERKQQEEIAFDIRDYGQKAKENVEKVTEHLVKTLIDQKQQLLAEIQKSITKAERNLRILHHTSAAQEYVKYFAQNGTASEMMEIRDPECSKKLTYEPFQQDVGVINFRPNEELHNQVETGLGVVAIFNKPADAKSCLLKVEPKIEAMKTTKLTIVLKTSEGKVAQESLDNITIQVTPEEDVKIGEKLMEVDGQAMVDLTAQFPGQVTAHVEVRGIPVCNSPVVMNVKPQNIAIKDLKLAKDMNVDSKTLNGITLNTTYDRIAVADNSSHCVRVFNMEGVLLLEFGCHGSGQEQYKYPQDLAFLNETDLVIADHQNQRICVVDTLKGKTVKTFGCQGEGNGQFKYPCGVCVDDASNIYVCDYSNHRIQAFTKDGDYLYQFNLANNGHPFDIITHKGLFYVSDYSSSVVHVFEMKTRQQPTIIRTIGGKDCSAGQLQEPRGLTIDSDGNLLVCNGKRVNKYTLDGRYIGQTNELSNNCAYIAVLPNGNAIGTTWGGGLFAI
ncbi:E3 ubiquitin-protein ligase TRIM71 [Exaiptasia diaphana]|nr:E3 ubiquitin-protein ligase TRIM71 [Exaiptasia diaphana]